MTRRVMQAILVVAGTAFVALGVVGIFLPLVPTAIFLLLAAACYARSSDRFYQRLLNDRWLGPYIRNHREHRGMSRRQKTVTLLLLWAGILASVVWSIEALWLRALLVTIAICVTIHVARLPAISLAPEARSAG